MAASARSAGSLAVLLTLAVLLPCAARAFRFDVHPGRMECFSRDLHPEDTLTGTYAVIHGGHQDVDFWVEDPNGKRIKSAKHIGEQLFTVLAELEGTYTMCWSNQMSAVSLKTVSLQLLSEHGEERAAAAGGEAVSKDNLDRVDRLAHAVQTTVHTVEFQQERYQQLHDFHRNLVSRTNSRVKLWTFVECVCVLAVSLLQIFYMKKLFAGGKSRRFAV